MFARISILIFVLFLSIAKGDEAAPRQILEQGAGKSYYCKCEGPYNGSFEVRIWSLSSIGKIIDRDYLYLPVDTYGATHSNCTLRISQRKDNEYDVPLCIVEKSKR